MGVRLTAGQQTLNLFMEVRILHPQPEKPDENWASFFTMVCLYLS